jgi:predicted DNA-binding transcriptional regulator AlpA
MIQNTSVLTVGQLADRWQKSKQWIYSNYRLLGLRVLPLGQQLRFPLDEIEAWERDHIR